MERLDVLSNATGSSQSSGQSTTTKTHGQSLSTRIQQTCKLAYHYWFMLFAAVNSSAAAATSAKTAVLFCIIETLQALWFAFSPIHRFPWNASYVGTLTELTKLARFDSHIQASVSGSSSSLQDANGSIAAVFVPLGLMALVTTAAVALLRQLVQLTSIKDVTATTSSASSLPSTNGELNTSPAVLVDQASSTKSDRAVSGKHASQRQSAHAKLLHFASHSVLLSVFTTAVKWCSTVLFMPLLALFLTPLRAYTMNERYVSDSSAERHIKAIGGLIGVALLLPISISYVVLKWPRRLTISGVKSDATPSHSDGLLLKSSTSDTVNQVNADALSAPHQRFALLQLILHSGLVAIYTLVTSSSALTQWSLCCIFTAVSVLKLCIMFFYMPLYHTGLLRIQVCAHAMVSWSGVALAVTLLYNDSDQPVGPLLFWSGAWFTCVITALLVTQRQVSLVRKLRDSMVHAQQLAVTSSLQHGSSFDSWTPPDPYIAELSVRLASNATSDAALLRADVGASTTDATGKMIAR